MNPLLALGQILVSIALIIAILLQARGTGLSGTFGGDSAVYRSRRGVERRLWQFTIVLLVLFVIDLRHHILPNVITVPGIGPLAARMILAEIGCDMSRFPSAAHLLSWAGLCPRNDESAGKRRSARLRKGAGQAAGAAQHLRRRRYVRQDLFQSPLILGIGGRLCGA